MKPIFLIFASFLQVFASELPDRFLIDSQFEKINLDLISMEGNLTKKLTNFGLQAKFCSSNLKASNLSKNFTDVLDNLMTAIQEIQVTSEHQTLNLSMDAISSYDYTQYRIATSFSDVKHYRSIIESIQANETRLYEFSQNLTKHYKQNYMKFVILKSKDKTVMATIRQFLIVFRDFGIYTQILKAHIGNLMKINAYLTSLIVSKAVIPPVNSTTSDFIQKIRAVESSLVPSQQNVIMMSKIAINKIIIAEKSVASRVKRSPQDVKDILSSLKNALIDSSSANDYPLVGWPQLPDLPSDGRKITLKLRASVSEQRTRNFEETRKSSNRNQTRIFEDRENLNKSTFSVSSSRKVGAQSQALIDVLSATMNVDKAFTFYISKIDTAIDSSRKLTPWPPCGSFFVYSTVTDMNVPAELGVLAGIYFDGSLNYVGRGDNGNSYGQINCPARISINSSKPGAFMEIMNSELYDNKSTEYLHDHPNLNWFKANGNSAFNNPKGLKVTSGAYTMMIARKNFTNYTQISKVTNPNGYAQLVFYDPIEKLTKITQSSDEFEVIGCN